MIILGSKPHSFKTLLITFAWLACATLALSTLVFGGQAAQAKESTGTTEEGVARETEKSMVDLYSDLYGVNRQDASKYSAQELAFVEFHTELIEDLDSQARYFDIWIARSGKVPTYNVRSKDPQVLARINEFEKTSGVTVQVHFETARGAQVAEFLGSISDEELESYFGVTFAGAGFDSESGGIALYTSDARPEGETIQRALRVADLVIPVTTVYEAESPALEATIIGGVKMQHSTTVCTVGFPATRSGVKGFYTADHCFDAGPTYNWFNRPANLGTVQGSATYWASAPQANADIMFMRLDNQGDSVSNTYFAGSSSAVSTIGSYLASTDGATVCKRGNSTGATCGTIEDATYKPSSNVCGGQTCNSTFVNSTYSSAAGDSGGPVYYSGRPMGIHTAAGGIYSNYSYRP
jgi:hypothetical protein